MLADVYSILISLILVMSHINLVTCNVEVIDDHDMAFWYLTSYLTKGNGEQWTHPLKADKHYTMTVTDDGVDHRQWLITKHIIPKTSESHLIYVDFKLELSSGHLDFYVYVNKTQPKLPIEPQKAHDYFMKNFTRVSNGSRSEGKNINYTFTFRYKVSNGVTFAIHSVGVTGKMWGIKLYYYYCPQRFMNSVNFSRTVSPSHSGGFKEVLGLCSENSVVETNKTKLKAFCFSNGTWAESDAKCLCTKGYEPNESEGCVACQNNYFKSSNSNSKCLHCPLNTLSRENRTRCVCKKGYIRLIEETNSTLSPCYAPLQMDQAPRKKLVVKGTINITWDIPRSNGDLNESITYDIECFTCYQKTNDCTDACVGLSYTPAAKNLKQMFVVVSKLDENVIYQFRVYPKNSLNNQLDKQEWNYSKISYTEQQIVAKTTPVFEEEELTNTESGISLHVILFAVAGVLVVVVALLVFVILRRRKAEKKYSGGLLNNAVELPSTGFRTYVDPTNYESPEDALGEFACELDPSTIQPEMLIGGGEFGDVYKGIMTKSNDERTSIALKTLKSNASPKSEKDFLLEASIIGQFRHPNVVSLVGVVSRQTPRMIVLEFMANGSLDHFLKINDSRLPQVQLITMSRGVAGGMEYLERMNYVHRDLAARNILVNEAMTCKVSDFGLSRHLETTDSSRGEYSTTGGKIPMRWTAPEAIKYRKFSSASDVWSFGILLWEIMSFAERPYWDWDNYRVIEKVDEGYRLPAPLSCPKGVHDLMLHCWSANRADRPSFTSIATVIDAWLETADTMNDDIALLTLLGQWLKRLKMEAYVGNFTAAGYDKPSQVIDMTDEDLKAIGIQLVGHRNKILKGLKVLKEMQKRRELKREVSLEV